MQPFWFLPGEIFWHGSFILAAVVWEKRCQTVENHKLHAFCLLVVYRRCTSSLPLTAVIYFSVRGHQLSLLPTPSVLLFFQTSWVSSSLSLGQASSPQPCGKVSQAEVLNFTVQSTRIRLWRQTKKEKETKSKRYFLGFLTWIDFFLWQLITTKNMFFLLMYVKLFLFWDKSRKCRFELFLASVQTHQ